MYHCMASRLCVTVRQSRNGLAVTESVRYPPTDIGPHQPVPLSTPRIVSCRMRLVTQYSHICHLQFSRVIQIMFVLQTEWRPRSCDPFGLIHVLIAKPWFNSSTTTILKWGRYVSPATRSPELPVVNFRTTLFILNCHFRTDSNLCLSFWIFLILNFRNFANSFRTRSWSRATPST